MPPPAAPIRARSETERFFMRDWTLGLFLDVGLSHCGALGAIWAFREIELEAKRGKSMVMACLWSWSSTSRLRGFWAYKREEKLLTRLLKSAWIVG
uniref:Mitochondrial substrate carrier n=1 Tax=Rhizophora mucronata TaxID=61149 RepID=A0A2P2PR71_RHIMU